MPNKPRDQFLDLPEGEQHSSERIDEQVQMAEQQQHALKRQLETVERQKRELEELGRRQDALNTGRADITDKLTRALVVLEREALEAGKWMETLQTINSSFVQHLQVVESIDLRSWEGLDIGKELTKALAAVDDARSEYAKSYPKVCASPGSGEGASAEGGFTADYAGGDGRDFLSWLKIGLAFSLPLIIFGFVAIVVIISRMPAK